MLVVRPLPAAFCAILSAVSRFGHELVAGDESRPTYMRPLAAHFVRPRHELLEILDGKQLDTALFDVDGVLIDTTRSYRLSVASGAEHLVRHTYGLDASTPMVTADDIAAFKRAGGFNSDWDLTQLFAALWTARLREWRGTANAEVPIAEWAARATSAAQRGEGGVVWMRKTFPASAIPDNDTARWAHDEYYWGADLVREHYGRVSQFAPDATGFVHNEELLLTPTLLAELAAAGCDRFGLITGRVGPEVRWAVRQLAAACERSESGNHQHHWHDGEHGRSPFGCIVPATVYAKPDPRALTHSLEILGSSGAFFAGDTADDLELVLRYRRVEHSVPVLAVMTADGEEVELYRQRGADIIVPHVASLPEVLARLSEPR